MTTTSKTTLTGREAIAYAREHGLGVQKYADPTEGAREVTPEEAGQIAREDPSLLWVLVEAASETKIINLTQHKATGDQIAAGVVDLPDADRARLTALLTFDTIPTREEIESRAAQVAEVAADYDAAMIGGAPFFMSALEMRLICKGVTPLYAFSVRESVEEPQADGTVKKVAVFRHRGFVPAR